MELSRYPGNILQKVGNTVKVIILSDYKPKHFDMIDELLENPAKNSNFKPFSRDEIYDRV